MCLCVCSVCVSKKMWDIFCEVSGWWSSKSRAGELHQLAYLIKCTTFCSFYISTTIVPHLIHLPNHELLGDGGGGLQVVFSVSVWDLNHHYHTASVHTTRKHWIDANSPPMIHSALVSYRSAALHHLPTSSPSLIYQSRCNDLGQHRQQAHQITLYILVVQHQVSEAASLVVVPQELAANFGRQLPLCSILCHLTLAHSAESLLNTLVFCH